MVKNLFLFMRMIQFSQHNFIQKKSNKWTSSSKIFSRFMKLKKRIIFTLLFCKDYFYLSRNFRLQKIGDLDWLKSNYNFNNVSFYIDELIILNVSRGTW